MVIKNKDSNKPNKNICEHLLDNILWRFNINYEHWALTNSSHQQAAPVTWRLWQRLLAGAFGVVFGGACYLAPFGESQAAPVSWRLWGVTSSTC